MQKSGTRPSNTTVQPALAQSNFTVSTPVTVPTSTTPLTLIAPMFPSVPTYTSLYVNASNTVLLQTALTKAYNPRNPSMTLDFRLILDSGSQRSYVTERAKNFLGLERLKTQLLRLEHHKVQPDALMLIRLVSTL